MRAVLVGLSALMLAAPASAQTRVGRSLENGLHWAVSAPRGASWRLICRFPPVTYERNSYDRNAWINQLTDEGSGPSRGRLPLDTGSCEVTKTGGPGPVGIAVGRTGEVQTGVARETGQTAAAGLFARTNGARE